MFVVSVKDGGTLEGMKGLNGRTDGTAVAAQQWLGLLCVYRELPDIRKAVRPRTFVFLVTATRRGRLLWSIGGMVIVTGENRHTGREEQPAQCQFVHRKSHTDRPEIEPRPTKLQTDD